MHQTYTTIKAGAKLTAKIQTVSNSTLLRKANKPKITSKNNNLAFTKDSPFAEKIKAYPVNTEEKAEIKTEAVTTHTDVNIIAFPNPAREQLYVNINGGASFDGVQISVWSATGVLVGEESTNNKQNVLDIAGLAPGVYVLKVQHPQSIYEFKFVKL